MKRLQVFWILAGALSLPALGAGVSKYKGWDDSPEAYFLTKAERADWAKVDSDESAEKFLATYREARGKGFAAAIQSRIDFADKNFSTKKRKGSQTLRGRVLIVFGAPTRVDTKTTSGDKEKTDITSGELLNTSDRGGSASGSNAISNIGGAGINTLRSLPTGPRLTRWDWVYDEKTVPKAIGQPAVTIEITVDNETGVETVPDKAKLDEMLSSVVEYWGPKKK